MDAVKPLPSEVVAPRVATYVEPNPHRPGAANAWLVGPVPPGLIFSGEFGQKYNQALAGLGVSAAMLSPEAGHA